jgi:hypothetical protein
VTHWSTTAAEYRHFAAMEARGRSPIYERLANGVAGDPELLDRLGGLPPAKRQPNLLFAAARHVGATVARYSGFRRFVLDHWDGVAATMLARRVQTNEPARVAAMYPLLAGLPQPLALLEVGASAGLCLLPDRYRYDFDATPAGDLASPVRIACRVEGDADAARPGPVTVAWRAGIDLNPLDVTNPDDVNWLRTLVWPEQHDRRERLEGAIALARTSPPRVVAGDLNERLAEVAAGAPAHATLVVYHTAVLYYLSADDRAAFARRVRRLNGHWISQECPGVLPAVDAALSEPPPADRTTYVLALDQRPVAFTAVHGGWLRWLSGRAD